MFEPVFVFDSQHPFSAVKLARAKKFRMVDIRQAFSSVHGCNPAVIVYDQNVQSTINDMNCRSFYLPLKNTGVMEIFDTKKGKGHVRALPDKVEFVSWFFGGKVMYFNEANGNFRVEFDGSIRNLSRFEKLKEWFLGRTIEDNEHSREVQS